MITYTKNLYLQPMSYHPFQLGTPFTKSYKAETQTEEGESSVIAIYGHYF